MSPQSQQIFFDPARNRWKRLMRVFTAASLIMIALLAVFVVSVLKQEPFPQLVLRPEPSAFPVTFKGRHKKPRPRRHVYRKWTPSMPGLPQAGVRASFYVNWDSNSYAALKAHLPTLDVVFAEWLHASSADGHIDSTFDEEKEYGRPDSAIAQWVKTENPDARIVPLVNNYDGTLWQGEAAGRMFADANARQTFRTQLLQWLNAGRYKGVVVDFENLPTQSQGNYHIFVDELHRALSANGIRMYLALPVSDDDYDLGWYGAHCDVAILMDYDEHEAFTPPGPMASQDWFINNLKTALKKIPAAKIMLGLANYAYDWPDGMHGQEMSVQHELLTAQESGDDVHLDPDSLNPTFDYEDDSGRVHHVWMTDAVTGVNEMRGASALGVTNFAIWRLGAGDGSLYSALDKFNDNKVTLRALESPNPGFEIDMEGRGDVFDIASSPEPGVRALTVDRASNLIVSEHYVRYPTAYRIDQYGWAPKTLVLSFDDGPDPRWTPQILDVLQRYHVPAVFFVIGSNAEREPELIRREYRQGEEIGNHTFLHPDSADISHLQLELEINTTARLIESLTGARTMLFRPPYGVDSSPETNDEVRPWEEAEKMGYIVVANSIDPHDWQPGRTKQQIVDSVLRQVDEPNIGNVILCHDGGPSRGQTIAALPELITALRARGYRFASLADLLGKSRADLMPPLSPLELWEVRAAGVVFTAIRWLEDAIIWLFILGIALMSGRVIVVGMLAAWQKFRPHRPPNPNYTPPLAVIIPAYNEEKVVCETVRSVLGSDYPEFRVIVVDDGSLDGTYRRLKAEFGADPRVLLLTKPNGGKATALNLGIARVTEEAFITIDADTAIAPDALRKLAAHLSDPEVGAIAGNAKVGNRINMVTWFQAGEYITSQNLERRALDALNCITVVPGAIGCWRTDVAKHAGGFLHETAAEDADLTMTIRRLGYRIVYEDGACAYTEAPLTLKTLMRQRFRWSYGILQTVWKHRSLFGREGTLGRLALPNIVVFQLLLPLFGPITDLMLVFAILMEWLRYTWHPQSWTPDSLYRLLFFFVVLMFVDLLGSVLAFALEHREQWSLVSSVLVQRFVYRHVMALVMLRTFKQALKGGEFAWGKLERTATVEKRYTTVSTP
jgi:cellulose synthase/poly-beta-1,6-N-acetylglucosamine synthase-like glycosyltransferase/peptidoglycan/xylan/chitin deacetylase (PgdA/CDA1 family)/spore germination protein YaaH